MIGYLSSAKQVLIVNFERNGGTIIAVQQVLAIIIKSDDSIKIGVFFKGWNYNSSFN
jgi:hypothetical protein